MEREAAQALYQQASELFTAGSYAQALGLLKTLDEEFPGERHIMLARARCIGKLGHTEEALAVCDELITKYDYQKAWVLRAELETVSPPIERTTAFSRAAVQTEWTMPRPAGAERTPWTFEWNGVASCFLALALALGGTGFFLALQGDPLLTRRAATFLASSVFVLLAGVPALYRLPLFREGAAYILWGILPGLILWSFLMPSDPESGVGMMACLQQALFLSGYVLFQVAVALAGIWLVLWLWDDMGIMFWVAILVTSGSFFIGVLVAKINGYFARHLGRMVAGLE